MRFHFTEEDRGTSARAADIRSALVHAGHQVTRGEVGAAPANTDMWFHGIAISGGCRGLDAPYRPPIGPPILEMLLESPAHVVLFQLCDADSMSFDRIPTALADRTRVFLRNHWPKIDAIPETFRNRIGFLPPMLKALPPQVGKPLRERSGGATFFGTRTGFSNMAGGKNAREEAVRRMMASRLPFAGGLVSHDDPRYGVEPELLVPRIGAREHARLLADSKVSLAPWGNHPITYRFFEGLSARCLVVAQSLSDVSFLDGGLEAGRHYAEVAPDLSDLVDVVRYYLDHLDEAQRIANAGYEHYVRHFAPRGGLISEWIFDATVSSWQGLYRASDDKSIGAAARATAAKWFPRRF